MEFGTAPSLTELRVGAGNVISHGGLLCHDTIKVAQGYDHNRSGCVLLLTGLVSVTDWLAD